MSRPRAAFAAASFRPRQEISLRVVSAYVETLKSVLTGVVGIVLVAAGFVALANPRRAQDLLKRVGLAVAGIILGAALLQQLAAGATSGDVSTVLGFGILSVLAYGIRQMRRTKTKSVEERGGERTPVMPRHFDGEDQ